MQPLFYLAYHARFTEPLQQVSQNTSKKGHHWDNPYLDWHIYIFRYAWGLSLQKDYLNYYLFFPSIFIHANLHFLHINI